MKSLAIFLLISIGISSLAFSQADDQLKDESLRAYMDREFQKYPSPAGEVAAKAKLKWRASSKARKYKTRLNEAWDAAKEPNFAGHYFAVNDIGCGTGCVVIFVVDWNTGKVFSPPDDDSFEVRKDSRLMILKPYDTCTAYGSPELYVFQDGHFEKKKNKTACDEAKS